ncbi:MAG: valine--tRNA ligase [Patescibacteria group bacterium]|nr:valine--tRNA ligase [Patescibacteria group bacterium]
MIRYHRMKGEKALWLPGTDHAGFETQVVFEKKLEKEGRSRFKMQREEFYKEIYEFVQGNKHITEEGLRRLGASCDWSRNIFTLDPRIIKIVYETFRQMHADGLIYRGDRIGNWCTKHQTALSDLETKYEEREDPLYYIKYGPIELATVRLETKFGDTAIAVNPKDKRYKKYLGKEIEIETLLGKTHINVIADEAVDMKFGTGAVKVTPAHDPVDFEIWQRHKDEIAGPKQVIDKYGRLNELTGPYAGMKVLEARKKIAEDMAARGLLDPKKTDHKYKHNVQLCYKCGNLIEPLVIPQWFVAMTKPLPDGRPSLRDMAVAAIEDGSVAYVPERFKKISLHWLNNIRDWSVSRQIWWGIPIPVKYCEECGETIVDIEDKIKVCPKCKSKNLVKDPDTFDTWFSSGQWPYATLQAWGKKDFDTYFPTQVMETAWDILFFWVARMIMFSHYRTGRQPFSTVFLHGLVRDKDRQKISKSKGNVIDPLGVIDLYGCDALRFALVFSTAAGNDIPLAEEKIRGMKHFGNKLWNIARFVISNVATLTPFPLPKGEGGQGPGEGQTAADHEILTKLNTLIKSVTDHLKNYRLHEAAQEIYQFTWHEFADVYLEASKKQLQDEKLSENTKKLLLHVLVNIIKLLHPFMPFITEEIWSKLHAQKLLDDDPLLMVSKWPI